MAMARSMANVVLTTGDPAPWFAARTRANATYHIDTAAGMYLVLSFYGSASLPYAQTLLSEVTGAWRPYFDDTKCAFFGISTDPADETQDRLPHLLPGVRHFFDHDFKVSESYGAIYSEGDKRRHAPFTLILDPLMRVLAVVPMNDISAHNATLGRLLASLPPIDQHAGVPIHAPILIVPRVFEPSFCRELISLYERHGGKPSGFMRQKDGATVGMLDPTFKKRKDFMFEEQAEYEPLRAAIRQRLLQRLVPEIAKAFQYDVSRIERYIVACYEGEEGGFFRRHRDNTTTGTAHRRFACTLNLNADDYEGGDLVFPEFGSRTYRAPTGGAVIFSCSLLHEATPVTRGTRFAFLPFLYDDAAAKIRQQNRSSIRDETGFKTATAFKPATSPSA